MIGTNFWNIFKLYLQKRPVSSQMLSGFWIAWFGDFFSQDQIENRPYNSLRGIVVGSYGALEIIVEGFLFFPLIDKAFGRRMTKLSAAQKVFCEQMLYTPTDTAMFIKWTNAWECQPETYHDKMSRDYLITLFTNWGYWGPVSFVNFCFVPLRFRALYVAGSTLIIDIIMSYATHNNFKASYERLLGVDLHDKFTLP